MKVMEAGRQGELDASPLSSTAEALKIDAALEVCYLVMETAAARVNYGEPAELIVIRDAHWRLKETMLHLEALT